MSKIGNKLKSLSRIFRNYTPRKLAITLLGVAAIAVPAAIFAATPGTQNNFTWDNPSGFVYFNSITDNPYWGDEHDFVRIVDTNGKLVNSASVQNGQTYTVQMLVHNDAAYNLNLVAKNVRAGLGYNTSLNATNHTITGIIFADNIGTSPTGNPGSKAQTSDTATFTGSSNFKLDYVEGSAIYTTQFAAPDYTSGGKVFQLSDSAINSGVSIGFDSMDGNIKGCWPNHGIFSAKFTVVTETPVEKHPAYDVEKSVDKATANPGDTLTYTIKVKNTGDENLTNVKVNDTLPANLTAINGSFTASPSAGVTGTIPGTVNIASLPVGSTVTLTVKAKVADAGALSCGNNVIKNVVTSSTDQTNNEDNTDNNDATTTVPKDCTDPEPNNPGMNLVKTVDKASASNGEVLNYTLTFKNTGDVDLENVVIKDSLPAGLTLVGEVKATGKNVTGMTDLDKLFTTGVKFAKVGVDGNVVITFSAKINDDFAKLAEGQTCGTASKELINNSSSNATANVDGNNVNVDESNKNDNSTSTIVNVDGGECKPNFDIEKSVDKTTANLGDELTYTLKFTNTGNQPLTNIVIADKLPAGVTLIANSVVINPDMNHSGNLFDGQLLVNGPLAPGASFTITYKVKINANMELACGNNILTNVVASGTTEKPTEDNTSNNVVDTNVPKECDPIVVVPVCPTNPTIPKDDPNCKPCPTNPDMNYDNPNCKPVVPPTVYPPTASGLNPGKPYNPGTIAATGPAETFAALLAIGALTFGGIAYMNSRRALKANFKK